MIVAVDGPAGSGKSSICAAVSKKIGWFYVNTGAIYRAVGVVVDGMGLDISREEVVVSVIDEVVEGLDWELENGRMLFKGEDITDQLSTVSASRQASYVARMPEVRKHLYDLERRLALKCPVGAIVEGRDIGTVIFPDADVKIFMTASLEERAKRRFKQMGEPKDYDLDEIMQDIARRDERDSGRDIAPLKQADDAVVFDTTGLDTEQTVTKMVEMIKRVN